MTDRAGSPLFYGTQGVAANTGNGLEPVQIYGHGGDFRLSQLWYDQPFLEDKASLRAGTPVPPNPGKAGAAVTPTREAPSVRATADGAASTGLRQSRRVTFAVNRRAPYDPCSWSGSEEGCVNLMHVSLLAS
jgi:hypothetical protein